MIFIWYATQYNPAHMSRAKSPFQLCPALKMLQKLRLGQELIRPYRIVRIVRMSKRKNIDKHCASDELGATYVEKGLPQGKYKKIKKSENVHNDQHTCEKFHAGTKICELKHNKDHGCAFSHMRLNRAIARSGYCSRRKADTLILSGEVKINGELQTNPATHVGMQDCIELGGKVINIFSPPVYIMLNKPIHTICTAHDPEGRQTVLDLLPSSYKDVRLFPVGRLDYFSEGLLILTNDGNLANLLMHPRHHLVKIYEVTIRGNISERQIKMMANGMRLEDGVELLPARVNVARLANGDSLLTLGLRQGVNRQIRRMCTLLDLSILRLRRIGIGSLKLADLEPGKTRVLTKEEVESLFRDAAE